MSSGMQSFYGGPNGQSFEIKKIFNTRVEMEADVTSKGWASSISVGEYVLISYGMPNEDKYKACCQTDLAKYESTYNSTLWQKIYGDTNATAGTGLSYKLVASMTGFTPRLSVDFTQLHSNQLPSYSWDNSIIDSPVLVVRYPRSQFVSHDRVFTEWLDAGSTADVDWDTTSSEARIDEPYVTFKIPQAQVLQQGTTTLLDPGVAPYFRIDSSNINKPVLNFWLPQTQNLRGAIRVLTHLSDPINERIKAELVTSGSPIVINGQSVQPDIVHPVLKIYLPDFQMIMTDNVIFKTLNANEDPYMDFITETRQCPAEAAKNPAAPVYNGTLERPIFLAALPQAQELKQGTTTTLHVGQSPYFRIDSSDPNNPVINFWLPVAQDLQQGTTTVLNADQSPSFSLDKSDIDKPVLNFRLPQAQIQAAPKTEVVGASIDPSVSLDDSNINRPQYTFSLPRAVRFFAGDLLGKIPGEGEENKFEVPIGSLPADLDVGDYYVNRKTGLIYLAIDKTATNMAFAYQTNLQAPAPKIASDTQSPYKEDENGDLVRNDATATRSFTGDPDEPWEIDFTLPRIPNVKVGAEFIGATDTGDATVEPIDKETIKFDFKVPSGTKIFAGVELTGDNQLNFHLDGSFVNDLYLNTDTGIIYKQIATNTWMREQGSLKGPVGDSLNIVRRYTFTEDDVLEDTEEQTYELIEQALAIDSEYGGADPAKPYPDPDEIIAVTWKVIERDSSGSPVTDDDGNIVYSDISYWCYYTEHYDQTQREWGRALLTGSVMSFISNEYVDDSAIPVVDRTYSISYINSLIGGNFDTDSDKKAFSKDQIINLLSWGSIGSDGTLLDADGNPYDPGKLPTTTDTLSVDEAVQLMSWGSLAELTL